MAEFTVQDASRLSHAYIIASPSRGEALRLAGRIAAAAVCRGSGALPCGHCRACAKAMAGIHPDILRVGRLADSKGQPRKEIVVDQIRQIGSDAIVLPNEAERKVYIIEDADSMNPAAQNAALKLLEEPPRGVHFLLCVQNPDRLLPTVRSRCAELNCGGETEQADEESVKLAAAFLRLVSRGDRLALCAWCAKNEGMDNRSCTAFLESVSLQLAERICGRQDPGGMDAQALLALRELTERLLKMLQVNVSVKQVFGLLAVDAIAGGGNRG